MDDTCAKEYIANLEKEFSLIENGFKEQEKRAFADYESNNNEHSKKLAFLAYKSNIYQVRMYSVFLFGYLSEQDDILAFMRDEVSKDDNWRVQEVLAKAFDEFCKQTGYEKALPIIDEWLKTIILIRGEQLQRDLEYGRADHISKIIRMKQLGGL